MSKWLILYQNPATARPGAAFPDLGPPGVQAPARSGGAHGALRVPPERQLDTPAAKLYAALRREVPDERVIQAMERVPRELFLAPGARHLACLNEALPIGQGQTISQPLIVAMMTSALQLTGGERVLEIGAGSGYQAAVLSLLARQVVTVERNTVLARDARERLAALGYRNVTVHESSAVLGWPQDAPYDAVIVTAAAPRVPQSLLDQLGEEGRIVIPVGSRSQQELIVAQKRGGQVQQRSLGGCRFVPLISPDAWDE